MKTGKICYFLRICYMHFAKSKLTKNAVFLKAYVMNDKDRNDNRFVRFLLEEIQLARFL